MKPPSVTQVITGLALGVSLVFIVRQRSVLAELRSQLAAPREVQTNEVLPHPAALKDDREQMIELARLRAQLAANPEQPATPLKQSIDPGKSVGGVRLGMTYEELIRELGSPSSTVGADKNGLSTVEYPNGVLPVCSNAAVIGVFLGEAFPGRTKEGIGIGSTGNQVLIAYGNPAETERNNDGSGVYIYPEQGIKFRVGPDGKVRHMTVRPVR